MIRTTLMTALLFTAPSWAQQTPTLAGSWERDPERSDDAEEKMEAAMQQMREQWGGRGGGMQPGGGGGGMPPGGGGRGGGGGGMPPGGGGRGGGGGGQRGERGRQPQMGRIPESLDAELEGNEFRIDTGERVEIFYLDGEKHKRQLPNGAELETVAEMSGSAIHIEEKMERGKMQRKYDLSPEGQTMIMTLTMKMGGMKNPVVIRTVHVRIDEGS